MVNSASGRTNQRGIVLFTGEKSGVLQGRHIDDAVHGLADEGKQAQAVSQIMLTLIGLYQRKISIFASNISQFSQQA